MDGSRAKLTCRKTSMVQKVVTRKGISRDREQRTGDWDTGIENSDPL